jgi:hypothetical protein
VHAFDGPTFPIDFGESNRLQDDLSGGAEGNCQPSCVANGWLYVSRYTIACFFFLSFVSLLRRLMLFGFP